MNVKLLCEPIHLIFHYVLPVHIFCFFCLRPNGSDYDDDEEEKVEEEEDDEEFSVLRQVQLALTQSGNKMSEVVIRCLPRRQLEVNYLPEVTTQWQESDSNLLPSKMHGKNPTIPPSIPPCPLAVNMAFKVLIICRWNVSFNTILQNYELYKCIQRAFCNNSLSQMCFLILLL